MVIRYQGGKKRFAKEIADVIIKYEEEIKGTKNMNIFSPFFGMGAVELELAKNNQKIKVHANDLNTDVIMMWEALKSTDWLPKEYITQKEYNYWKNMNSEESDNDDSKKTITHSPERGFYLCAYAFGGIFGHGSRHKYQSLKKTKDEGLSAYNAVKNVRKYLDQFSFTNDSYTDFTPTRDEIVYADPPYESSSTRGHSSGNKYLDGFDSDEFWDVMREWSKITLVFISEEQAPKDFKCIWRTKKAVARSLGSVGNKKKRECLFIHERYV